MLNFWERRHEPNVLFLKYEEMKKDLPAAIAKCARFLNVAEPLSNDDIDRMLVHLNFEQMQNNTAVNLEAIEVIATKMATPTNTIRFIRKGQVGDWKNYMSADLSSRFDEWIERNSKGSDLKFEYE